MKFSDNKLWDRRLAPLWCGLLFFFFGELVLRFILFFKYVNQPFSLGPFLNCLWIGFRMDAVSALLFFLPLTLWLELVPEKIFQEKWHLTLLQSIFSFLMGFLFFIFIAEIGFFDEFNARFNTVAVDYLIYPQEVVINIWDSYPLGKILFGCFLVAGISFWIISKNLNNQNHETTLGKRIKSVGAYLLMGLLAMETVSMKSTKFSSDRVLNEVANSGVYSFFYAAFTRHLDYPAFYLTLPRAEAF